MSEHNAGGSVPVPNRLFDDLLPKLTDADLRICLIVVRATLGWRESNGHGGWRYKRRDWLTNRLLMKRTGRGSASVSRAVQSLVSASLIRVESAAGELLDSPEKRRRNLGRLYFALGDMWITPPPRDNGEARTTTNTRDNKIGALARARSDGPALPVSRRAGMVRIGEIARRPSDHRGGG
jgi:hypothetical protein